jgi:hypothetical protein
MGMFQLFVMSLFLRLEAWLYIAAMLLALLVLVGGRQRLWLFVGLGGFLLGQLLGATILSTWSTFAVFGLSAAIGAAMGALTRVAERPLLAVASFSGVGFLAFALCGLFGVGGPWNLIAYLVAGGGGAALLFSSFDRALNINPTLAAAATIAASIGLWFPIIKQWGGWSELIVTAVVIVAGLIHLFQTFPVREAAPMAKGAVTRAD